MKWEDDYEWREFENKCGHGKKQAVSRAVIGNCLAHSSPFKMETLRISDTPDWLSLHPIR
jgi:hypothetical protein